MRQPILFAMLLSIAGLNCASGPDAILQPDYATRVPRIVVVTPPKNDTVDLDAPALVHQRTINEVGWKGYGTFSHPDTMARLLTKNIKEGGQIDSMTAAQLGEMFGADAILYVNITDFETTTLVAYTQISVGAQFRLVDAKTNQKLWECEHVASDTTIAAGRNWGEALAKGLVDTAVAALTPYEPYVDEVVSYCFSSLPNASGELPEDSCLP